jgi:transcriptional regulator GlxA family with amidase domain
VAVSAASHDVRVSDAPAPPTHEVLLFDGFDELDAVGPFEVLAAAGLPVRPVGLPGAASIVRAGNGLRVVTEAVLGDDRAAVLVVPGGGWTDGGGVRRLVEEGALPRALAAAHAEGAVLASVCTGAMLLGAAGLLAGRPAVTNALALDDLRALGVDVRADARVVDDGDVLTAGGPLAGIDLGIRLVERALGPAAAEGAAARLEHDRRGPLVVPGGAGA